MNDKDLLSLLRSQILEGMVAVPLNGGFKISLPLTNSMGDPIEIFVNPEYDELILDDLGHTAGLLFQLGQHGADAPGHELIKNLCAAYDIVMDYNRGVIFKRVSVDELSKVLDFIKVLTSVETVLPEMPRRKKERRTGKRLGTLLGQEIKQLRLPVYVQRQVEVEGRHEIWVVDYKYARRMDKESVDVIIVTADLRWGEPRQKAAHVVTLAVDVLGSESRKDLRIVYDVGRNGNGRAAGQRAADLIEDNQGKIGYKAYNYGDSEQKAALASLIHQELSPFAWRKDGG